MHRMSGVVLRTAAAALLLSAAARAGEPYKRWAVIASPKVQTSGLVDLVTVQLSQVPGIELVEREQLEAAAKELHLDASVGDADIRTRLQLGTILRADALVLLSVVTKPAEAQIPPVQGPDSPVSTGLSDSSRSVGPQIRVAILDCRQGVRLQIDAVTYDSGALEAVARPIVQRVLRTRDQFPDGVRQIIGVSPFVCRNLTHEYDRYQGLFGSLLQNALVGTPGVTAIETQEASAIRQEQEHAEGPSIDRVVPVFVEGQYEMTPRSPASSPSSQPGEAPAGPAVHMIVRITNAAGKVQALERKVEGLNAAALLLTTELPAEVLQMAGQAKARQFAVEEQFQSLVSRADAFAAIGAWDQAVGLREAAILLKPNDARQRRAAANDYGKLLTRRGMYTPAGIDSSRINPDVLSPDVRRVCWQAYREHVDYLVRSEGVSAYDAVLHAGNIYREWPDSTAPADSREAAQRQQERRQYLLTFFPLILRLPGAGSVYCMWQSNLMALATLPLEEFTGTTFTRDDANVVLHVMREAIPRQPCVGCMLDSLMRGPQTFQRHPEWAWLVEQLATSDNPLEAFYARYIRASLRLNKIPTDAAGIRNLLDDLDGVLRDYRKYKISSTGSDSTTAYIETLLLRHREKLLQRLAAASQAATQPRVSASRPAVYWRSPSLAERTEEKIGRLVFRPIPMEYRDLKGSKHRFTISLSSYTPLNPTPGLEGIDEPCRGYCMCKPGLDVAWDSWVVAIMRTKGQWQEVCYDQQAYFCDAVWDGERIWVASRYKGILVLDPQGQVLGRIGEAQGLPPADHRMRLQTIAPGKVCAIGWFGEENRVWCATVEWNPTTCRVNVFHRAMRVSSNSGDSTVDSSSDRTFLPRWIHEGWRASPVEPRRLLVGRSKLMPPLVINLEDLQVGLGSVQNILQYDIPPICHMLSARADGPGRIEPRDADGCKLPDGRRTKDNEFGMPAGSQRYDFSAGEWLIHDGLIDIPKCHVTLLPAQKDLGTTWLRFNLKTGQLDRLCSEPLPQKLVDETGYAISGHYGILMWNEQGQFWQVEVEEPQSPATQAK